MDRGLGLGQVWSPDIAWAQALDFSFGLTFRLFQIWNRGSCKSRIVLKETIFCEIHTLSTNDHQNVQ